MRRTGAVVIACNADPAPHLETRAGGGLINNRLRRRAAGRMRRDRSLPVSAVVDGPQPHDAAKESCQAQVPIMRG